MYPHSLLFSHPYTFSYPLFTSLGFKHYSTRFKHVAIIAPCQTFLPNSITFLLLCSQRNFLNNTICTKQSKCLAVLTPYGTSFQFCPSLSSVLLIFIILGLGFYLHFIYSPSVYSNLNQMTHCYLRLPQDGILLVYYIAMSFAALDQNRTLATNNQ